MFDSSDGHTVCKEVWRLSCFTVYVFRINELISLSFNFVSDYYGRSSPSCFLNSCTSRNIFRWWNLVIYLWWGSYPIHCAKCKEAQGWADRGGCYSAIGWWSFTWWSNVCLVQVWGFEIFYMSDTCHWLQTHSSTLRACTSLQQKWMVWWGNRLYYHPGEWDLS
jgi:hypothetical protein